MDWKPISGCFEAGAPETPGLSVFIADMLPPTFQKPALKRIEFPRSLERKHLAGDLATPKIIIEKAENLPLPFCPFIQIFYICHTEPGSG